MKQRLDQALVAQNLTASRSQAESYIKLGYVTVNGIKAQKSGSLVAQHDVIAITVKEQYVSRAALKLASVAHSLNINFTNRVVLDVGSSTGGFTDYALRNGAKKVIDVELGTDQLHPTLRGNPKIELYEKTDIRNFYTDDRIDIVVADVSFISLRDILPHIRDLSSRDTHIIVMVKPQFEAMKSNMKHKGVIKNDAMRRTILKDFESWTLQYFMILQKADSGVSGAKGNKERFYLLAKIV
jgi:23S rRNA (cytidine1920-2'-O)/16S rRNA (cytidine1409-2'-O)-methyltransferase